MAEITEGYLGALEYKVLREGIEDRSWAPVLHNKLLTDQYMRPRGIPLPDFHGFLQPESGFATNGAPFCTGADLLNWVKQTGRERIVLKPIGAGRGRGVRASQRLCHDGQPYLLSESDTRLTAEVLDGMIAAADGGLDGMIVQERLRPHAWFDALIKRVMCSFRIMTFHPPRQVPIVQMAFMRLGRPGAETDHAIAGGVSARIDHLTGKVGPVLIGLPGHGETWQSTHPDTGAQLEGAVVPNWGDVMRCALDAAASIPPLRAVGWDIMLTDHGPVVLEGNLGWGLDLVQAHHGGLLSNGVVDTWAQHVRLDVRDGSPGWTFRNSRRIPVRLLRMVARGIPAMRRVLS